MENKVYNHPYFGEFYYSIDIPEQFKNGEKAPLLLFLHGAGERGKDYELLRKIAVPRFLHEGKIKVNAITVCPQCPEGVVWVNLAHMLKDFVEYIIKEYNIDREKMSVTGVSMGGYGTWEMSIFAPDLFKKAAPICGGGTAWRTPLIKADVWAFHGDADTVVPTFNSIEMVDAAKRAGKNARLTLLHGVEHNSWDEAYLDSRVLEWLCEF